MTAARHAGTTAQLAQVVALVAFRCSHGASAVRFEREERKQRTGASQAGKQQQG